MGADNYGSQERDESDVGREVGGSVALRCGEDTQVSSSLSGPPRDTSARACLQAGQTEHDRARAPAGLYL